MKSTLCLVLLFVSATAQARIVLLTSFENSREQMRAERVFRKAFKQRPAEVVEVVHQADQWALYRVLKDLSVEGVFWISHGVSARSRQSVQGASLQPKLLDYRGDNVAPVFSLLSPAIKFVAVIGCDSANILEHYGVKLTGVTTYIPAKRRVALERQVPRAVRAFRQAPLDQRVPEPEPLQVSARLKITRQVDENENVRSLRVYVGDHLVGLVPNSSGETEFTIEVTNQLKVKLESGQQIADQQADFGKLTVTSADFPGRWTLFTNREGIPFGVNHRLFIYRDSSP